MATIDDLRRQQQIAQQQSESLSERLEKLDQVTRVVDPQIRASALDFTNRPVLSNPLNDVQMALELGEASRSERSSALADLTSAQDRAVSLADKVDVMSRRGGGGRKLSPIEMLMQKAQVMQLAKENPDLVRLDPDTFSQALGLVGINTQFTPDTPQGPSLPGMEQGSANTVVSLEKLLGLDQEPEIDPLKGQDKVAVEKQLREELRKSAQDNNFFDLKNANRTVQSADDNAAGDLSLIFSYMKILDPGSTVREGEFANAQNSAGVPGQIRNLYNRVKSGKRLNSEQRSQFKTQANEIYNASARQQILTNQEFERLATGYGVDPKNILGVIGDIELEDTSTQQQAGPQPSPSMQLGVILQSPDGQIFQYDDPNDPEIQEALQFGYKVVQ